MKHIKIIYLLVIFLAVACQSKDTKKYIEDIEQQRVEKNETYSDSLKSPLNPAHLAEFEGLKYFPVDPAFRVEGILEITPKEKPFEMTTSTDRVPIYRKYGNIKFKIKGDEYVLSAYQNMDFLDDTAYADFLFLPFQDLTSSKESYGGGRYIDLRIPETEKITIDFNMAYNPYCAYYDRWSCVIPPPENFLEVKILAGEKKFHLSDH